MTVRLARTVALTALALAAVHCASDPKRPSSDHVEESHPGSLVFTSPDRGAFIAEGDPVIVRGSGASHGLTINGKPVSVAANGEFETKVDADPGMNVVTAVDGASRLELPFLYGHFEKDTPVAHALTIDLGTDALVAPLPAASVTSIANAVLANRDLLSMLNGREFSGTNGVDWKLTINKAQSASIHVDLNSAPQALGVDGSLLKIQIDGRIQIKKGLTYADDARITAGRAYVGGNLKVTLDQDKGALSVQMPDAEVQLDGFNFDSGTVIVDSIVTKAIQSKLESAVQDELRNKLAQTVSLTLEGMGIPRELDLSFAKIPTKIPIATKFDAVLADTAGASLSAAALFGGGLGPATPGATAPGSLVLGGPFDPAKHALPRGVGLTIALDSLNQALYAAWATGTASFTVPKPLDARLTPALPPLLSITDAGALRVALGEITVQRDGSPGPMAAATIIQDVRIGIDGDALLLSGAAPATIAITWLADDGWSSGSLIADAAKSQLGKFLQNYRVPIPKIALDKLGGDFAGRSLLVDSPAIVLDKASARVNVSGNLKLVGPPAP